MTSPTEQTFLDAHFNAALILETFPTVDHSKGNFYTLLNAFDLIIVIPVCDSQKVLVVIKNYLNFFSVH